MAGGDDTEVEAYVANEQAMIPLLRGLGFEPSATDPKRWRRKAEASSVSASSDRLDISPEDVEKAIQSAKTPVKRMGGGCFAWAVAIKRVLVPEGLLVVGLNKAVFEANLVITGHAAVVVDDPESRASVWFDSEGITSRDNVDSWGMLDESEDTWYAYGQPGSLSDWQTAAYEADVMVMDSEDELFDYLPAEVRSEADKVEQALKEAAEKIGLK